MNLNGIPVVVSELIPAPIVGYRQRRTHRRSKVNKKWLHRFGSLPIYGPAAFMMDGMFIVNSAQLAVMKKMGSA